MFDFEMTRLACIVAADVVAADYVDDLYYFHALLFYLIVLGPKNLTKHHNRHRRL